LKNDTVNILVGTGLCGGEGACWDAWALQILSTCYRSGWRGLSCSSGKA